MLNAINKFAPFPYPLSSQQLSELNPKLHRKDLAVREDAFKRAEKYINNEAKCGAVDATISRTFKVKDTEHERIDIEIITVKVFTE
ncbi:hypothetical protein [Pseudomonas sp. W2-17]|uniref:hypothetical protein n=1 Tax=Pseudomonas sp. W2-17 TaxID=3058039 RepID=UPI0034E0DBED